MIIRIFRARLKPGARTAYTRLCYDTSLPLMHVQPGCRAAYIAPARRDQQDQFVVVSVWDDLQRMRDYVGDDWEQPILAPGEASMLEWARVEHYDGAFHSLVRLWQAHADVMLRREIIARNAVLSDRQWEAIQGALPAQRGRGRPRADDRRTLNGSCTCYATAAAGRTCHATTGARSPAGGASRAGRPTGRGSASGGRCGRSWRLGSGMAGRQRSWSTVMFQGSRGALV